MISVFCLIFYNYIFHAQNLDSLLIDYQLKEISQINEICDSQKLNEKSKWLNLLPSVSYSATGNTFSVGINLNSFSNYFQQKKRNKIEIEKLRTQLLQRLDAQILQLNQKINDYFTQSALLQIENEKLRIAKELHQINRKKYENNQITHVAFLNSKASFLNAKKSFKNFENQLNRKLNYLLQIFTKKPLMYGNNSKN